MVGLALRNMKQEWLDPNRMQAAFAVGVVHGEAEFSQTAFIETANALVFAYKVLEYW